MADVTRQQIAWTGDNPFIYLKTDPDSDWSSVSLFFRITASAHGIGSAILVVEAPNEPGGGDEIRVLLTDNRPLADYLIESFVKRFPLFRPFSNWDSVRILDDCLFISEPGATNWAETGQSPSGGVQVKMTWRGLEEPFAVDLQPDQSATGQNEMLSVFRTATSGSVDVNGRALPGVTIERDFLGGRCQSAAMALSETWIA